MKKVSRLKVAREFVSLLEHHSVSKSVRALANQVVEQRLSQQIDLLLMDISGELLRQQGLLEVDVSSAHRLTVEIKSELMKYLKAETGARSVRLDEVVDEDLLGGLVARTSELELDLSVKKQLERLKV